jgi:aspartyl-tRNA(Asn)/glutamyl-tRNA(Gln) amidotransferase subunit B
MLGVRAALGLECEIHESSVFARKNYFYPDLPKGYQITQFDRPFATGGVLRATGVDGERRVRLRRIHLEEDAGKSLHDRLPGLTAIDLNRAGTPLIEIVTEPDIRTPQEARALLARLRQTLLYLDVSDCDMEKGSLRVDANVSVRRAGATELGTKTEVKNMNSFSNVERALSFEIDRQIALVSAGDAVTHETLLWDAARGIARPMRSKEESHDYRYFPEPDLPPLGISSATVESIRETIPELPAARERRFVEQYGLPAYDAEVLCASRALASWYEDLVAAAGGDAKSASNWVMTDVLGWLNQNGAELEKFPIQAAALGELITLVGAGTISNTIGRKVFARMIETGESPAAIVEAEGWVQIRDESRLEEWARAIVAAHPGEVERYRGGDAKLLGFFMGRLMKESGGKADPKRATQILRGLLDG